MTAVPNSILKCDCRKNNFLLGTQSSILGSLPHFCSTFQKISQQIKKEMLLFQEISSLKDVYTHTQNKSSQSDKRENILINVRSTFMHRKNNSYTG